MGVGIKGLGIWAGVIGPKEREKEREVKEREKKEKKKEGNGTGAIGQKKEK